MTHQAALILPFAAIDATDLALVGGKGANLGEMTRSGFPVPDGFCLTTLAFEQFMAACPDVDRLYAALDSLTMADVDQVRKLGEHVRRTLLAVPMPNEVADAVRRAWQARGKALACAVRSSATAEDLPDASFAGQQDTYLNLVGPDALLDAIRRCWVSLFTDRAILYRYRSGFSHRQVQIAVVVQTMIMAETSGVLFTADPLSGHRHTLTMDASLGLGEALVGGLVSPDAYRIDKRTLTIIERQIADKEIAIYPQTCGGTRVEQLGPAQRLRAALTDAQVLALAAMGCQVEDHYGVPQDIEWAMADGQLYLLQARPITSLYPLDGLASPDDSLHLFFSMGHQQSMTRAMAPLSLSTLQVLVPVGHEHGDFDNSVVCVSGGRIYADLTMPLRRALPRRAMLGLLAQMDALAPEAVRQVMRRPEWKPTPAPRLAWPQLKLMLRVVWRVLSALLLDDLTGFVDQTNALIDNYIAEVSRALHESPPGQERLRRVVDTLLAFFRFFLNWVPQAGAGIASARLLTRLAQRWLTPVELEALTLGIPGNVVNDMNLAIGDLADLAGASPQLRAMFTDLGADGQQWLQQATQQPGSGPFMAAWSDLMARYGARGPSEIDLRMPRWYEDPLPVLRVIAEFMNSEPGRLRAHQRTLVQGRQAAMQTLRRRAGAGTFGRLRRPLLNRLYHVMISVGGMREHHKLVAVRLLALIKELLIDQAQQWVAAEILDQTDDIWFLTWPELFAICQEGGSGAWGRRITQRRAELARYQKLTPPLVITSDGESPAVRYPINAAPEGALLGQGVAAGVVEGLVHVIRDPRNEALAPGEILVTEFTDPGWTPLFINAGGLILEVGGTLTHGAVVAREYGIPAIVGVRHATTLLHTGQRVRLDGNRGLVELL